VARYTGPQARRRAGSSDSAGWRRALERVLPWIAPPAADPPSPYPIAGFAGLWLMVDEAHVTTIGEAPEHRGKHIGEMLFLALIDIAMEMKANWLTLEVRVSNSVAQNLYRKYGMQVAGTRKRYYSDNGEDAYIMWSEPLSSPAFQERLAKLRAAFNERMAASGASEIPPPPPMLPVRPAPERNS
jgi:ribosomal-protein-alanine N-acetyltransferase